MIISSFNNSIAFLMRLFIDSPRSMVQWKMTFFLVVCTVKSLPSFSSFYWPTREPTSEGVN